MERRDFLKLSAVTSATAALSSCGHPEHQLIRFVPEEELVPGVAVWKPSICTLCPAGCGLMVRVMEGEAEIIRNGQLGLIKMGLAKKLEGNPNHPISQGKLCPRGQAGLQLTYHPDRVKNPLKRSGPRGSGQFQEISWDEAIKELVTQLAALVSAKEQASLAFVTRPLRGQRQELLERFLAAFGAPPPAIFEFFDDAVLQYANNLNFGLPQLPTFRLANSNYVASFGADFLGTWNSPVAQSVAYGEMRQGRPGQRGKLVQFEQRLSQTGANADEWISLRPGTEGVVALGLAHVIINEGLRPASSAGSTGMTIPGWSRGLPEYTPQEVEKRSDITADKIARIAREMATHGPAVAIIGGTPLAQTNGLFNALAVNALNALLGSVGKTGDTFFTPQLPLAAARARSAGVSQAQTSSMRAIAEGALSGRPGAMKALLLYEANPVFATPPAWRVRESLERIPFIASFGSFLDETSALADLVLPDHSPLESWMDDVPASGTPRAVASLAAPAMRPLHDTRSMPDVLLEVAQQLGSKVGAALPWKTYEEMLRTAFEQFRKLPGSIESADAEEFWSKAQEQGGWWSSEAKTTPSARFTTKPAAYKSAEPQFDGDGRDFPFHFQPYASQMFFDGSLAHLPWMQEAPDPLATAMWGTWVEINPKTADRLGIKEGDLVEVASQHGKLEAPTLLSPGIAPDVIAMPVGQGHENFTRYASGRGANPISILAPVVVPETGSLAWAATRVKVSRVGKGKLILFAGSMREHSPEHERR